MRAATMALLVAMAATAVPAARAAEDEAAPAKEPAAASGPPPAAPSGPTPATDTAPGQAGPAPGIMRPPKAFPKLRQASLLHKNQLGIAVLPGIGYRGIFPYQENINCGQQGKRVCTGV